MKKLAKFFSVLFHPIFLLNFGLFILFKVHPYYYSKFYEEQFFKITILIVSNTLIMPIITFWLLKRFKLISDFEVHNPRERLIPYASIAFLIGFTAFQFYRNDLMGLPFVFLITILISLLLNIIINFKFKISSHTIGAGGLIALFLFLTVIKHISLFTPYFIAVLLIAGITGWARMELKAHNEAQIYSGYLLGFLVVFLGLMYLPF